MTRYLATRLLHAVLVLGLVCTTTFAIMQAAPGGPALLADPKLGRAEREALTRQLGLDAPPTVQFVRWVTRAARGDLGTSFLYQAPTRTTIGERLPNTLMLAGAALLLALLVGVPLGIAAGTQPGSALDRWVTRGSVLGTAVPAFWLGIVLILVFAARLQWLPAGGVTDDMGGGGITDRLRHLVLPAVVLALPAMAELYRYARSATREAVGATWWRAARARGLPRARLVWRHSARHAALTVLSVLGLQLPRLAGGAAITETVFSWPGMGRLGVEAALARDYPLVMGVTLVVSVAVLAATLLVDIAQGTADPRVHRA